MRYTLATLRAAAALLLVCAGPAAWGAAPVAVSDEEAVASVQTAFHHAVAPGAQADLHRNLLASVLQRVKRSHAAEVDLPVLAQRVAQAIEAQQGSERDPAVVFKKAVNETLRGIDAYARYIDPRTLGNDRASAAGSFGGLGVEVQPGEGAVRVVAAIPGGPAARAGLQAGDLILRVDDLSLVGLPLSDAIERLRGQPGTPVSLTVRRTGTEADFTVALTRDIIRRDLLRWSFEDDVLQLRLSSFSGAVAASLASAVADATAQRKPRAVVLDLRGNPGGLLREGVRVADAFLDHGDIVSLRGAGGALQRTWTADADELLPGVPMVVLVDARSASASELVADALQHHGRAIIMGQRSYGKGSVQTTYSLGDERGALKLTTASYHGPSGQTVQGLGVTPDIELMGLAGPRPSSADATAARAAELPVGARRLQTRITSDRCAPSQAADPALACARTYLLGTGGDAFLTGAAH